MNTICEHMEYRDECIHCLPDDAFRLAIYILRHWDRDKIERFAKHLLGDKVQEEARDE